MPIFNFSLGNKLKQLLLYKNLTQHSCVFEKEGVTFFLINTGQEAHLKLLFHQVTTLFEQARRLSGGKH
jgi:hypothetical protein